MVSSLKGGRGHPRYDWDIVVFYECRMKGLQSKDDK